MASRSIAFAATGPCLRASRRSATAAAVRLPPDGSGLVGALPFSMSGAVTTPVAGAPVLLAPISITDALDTAFIGNS